MIKKVDVLNYGAFKNFEWVNFFGTNMEEEFGFRNIIYGRNYAGKTTLSRIVRSLQTGKQHKDFLNCKYTVTLDDGKRITESDISDGPYNFRVYNSDFRKDNLNFLYNDDGEILPFTILGEENIDVQRKIKQEKEHLDVVRGKISNSVDGGLSKKFNDTKENLSRLENELSRKLREKASDIRNNPILFIAGQQKKYDIRDIESEINLAKPLEQIKEEELKNILKEEIKEEINQVSDIDFNYSDLLDRANLLLEKSVKPSLSIQELLKDNIIQEWVRKGIELHKDKREDCAFCGNTIALNRWEELDRHFTKEVEDFTKELDSLMQKIIIKINYIKDFVLPLSKSNFYSIYHETFYTIIKELDDIKVLFINNLELVFKALEERRKNIFTISELIRKDEDLSLKGKQLLANITILINKNNTYTTKFSQKQNESRNLLRYNEIYKFLKMIDYNQKVFNIKKEALKLENVTKEKEDLEKKEKESISCIQILEASLKDEKSSVRLVNKYLKTFLGHPELYLEIDEGSTKDKVSKFVIMRNENEAKNLSEGEQSLIAFCYFLATLGDISNIEDYTIFIDDPICSLDSNHIFYIFSLLDSEIVSKKYKQVFISTHNLEFLKYLQKITKPTNNKKYNNKYFFIEKYIDSKNDVNSVITRMPEYLKTYSTEFIYLFHQIYRVANENESDENYQIFYGFPNSARKFIETYMFFKYPDFNMSNDQRIQAFFNHRLEIKAFLNRINNEFSHGENQPERLLKPIDIPEFKKNAKIILEAIRSNDEEQYYAFLGSLGVMPEIESTEPSVRENQSVL